MANAEMSNIVIPTELLQTLGRANQEIKIELAIFFYQKFQLSSDQAAKFAGIPRVTFFYELGKRKIPVNYDENDAKEDIDAITRFNKKFPIE